MWSYGCGIAVQACSGTAGKRLVAALAIAVDTGILVYFKYFDFFAVSIAQALEAFGLRTHIALLHVALPVGISFYTFQAMGYVIDVYRGTVRATRDAVAYAAFIGFFPQLVAGPIERASNLLPQFLKSRRFSYPLAVDGCRQMLWGYFKKMTVADACAYTANSLLSQCGDHSSVSRLVGLLCFTFQIYGDFSGYSDMAIGCAKLFGFTLCRNFAYPYFACGIADFWRRWHMSLTTWFKDYLYIPLGGSRCSLPKTVRNTFAVFLVSGLWHGANWTFLAWGAVHAAAFMPSLLARRLGRRNAASAAPAVCGACRKIAGGAATFATVVLGWAFFRAGTVGEAIEWLREIIFAIDLRVSPLALSGTMHSFLCVAAMLAAEFANRRHPHALCRLPANAVARHGVYLAVLFTIVLNMTSRQTFIYFQF